MRELTQQEIFDKSYKAILAQGALGIGNEGCVYRAPNGNRCAIGVLISKKNASLWENTYQVPSILSIFDSNLFEIVERDLKKSRISFTDNKSLLSELQYCHDVSEDLQNYKIRMKDLARKFNLKFDESL